MLATARARANKHDLVALFSKDKHKSKSATASIVVVVVVDSANYN